MLTYFAGDVKTQEQVFYFCSDIHFGSPNSDVKLFKEELKQAKERKARILIIGDLFDAIYPLGDPRYNPSSLIEELQGRDDAPLKAVMLMSEILKPYQEHIDLISMGNHEAILLKHTGNHLIKMLLMLLNQDRQHKILYGGYTGYIGYRFKRYKATKILSILYHHGSGGGAPVTKGLIDVNRKQTNWDYDIFIFGHKHNAWGIRGVRISPVYPNSRSKTGYIKATDIRAIQIGNFYKNYNKDNSDGVPSYEEIKQHAPKPLGGVFVKVKLVRTREQNLMFKIKVEV